MNYNYGTAFGLLGLGFFLWLGLGSIAVAIEKAFTTDRPAPPKAEGGAG